jgi:hypothetical protein
MYFIYFSTYAKYDAGITIVQTRAMIVENAPLGVEAANKVGIQCIVVLNDTALTIKNFKSVIDEDRTLKDTRSTMTVVLGWCNRY